MEGGAVADGERDALVARVAQAQAIAGVGAALLAAMLTLDNQAWAPWALILTALASGGAGFAYLLVQRRQTAALAGIALLASHLTLLAWAFELDGPRMALLAFVPGLALLAVRIAGRRLAVFATGTALILYLAWTLLRVRAIFLSGLLWSRADAAHFDALLVAAGCLLAVLALLHLFDERDAALRRAEAHEREAEVVRVRYALLLEELAADSEHLERVLAGEGAARRRVSTIPMAAHDAPRSLDDLIAFAASRIETLQRDREDRVRLEGALARLRHAVELIELGRAPRWPAPTGTSVDAVIAHLRELYPEVSAHAPFTAAGYPLSHPFSPSRALPSILAAAIPTAVILPWRHTHAEEGA